MMYCFTTTIRVSYFLIAIATSTKKVIATYRLLPPKKVIATVTFKN